MIYHRQVALHTLHNSNETVHLYLVAAPVGWCGLLLPVATIHGKANQSVVVRFVHQCTILRTHHLWQEERTSSSHFNTDTLDHLFTPTVLFSIT